MALLGHDHLADDAFAVDDELQVVDAGRDFPPLTITPVPVRFVAARLRVDQIEHGDARSRRMIERRGDGDELLQYVVDSNTDDCQDRKSTRLNSSHVKISYAGFCLIK